MTVGDKVKSKYTRRTFRIIEAKQVNLFERAYSLQLDAPDSFRYNPTPFWVSDSELHAKFERVS